MKIFSGNVANLPPAQVGEHNDQQFDEEVYYEDGDGQLRTLVGAGVSVHKEYHSAVKAHLKALEQKPAPAENKSRKPATENK